MRPAIVLRRYRHGDFDEIEPRADFAAEQAAMGWPLRREPPPDQAWTALRSGQPVGCGGYAFNPIAQRWRGWLYLSCLTPREWAEVVRICKRTLRFMDLELPNAMEASALFSNVAARHTLERLGFVHEASGFTHGDDAYVLMIREAG